MKIGGISARFCSMTECRYENICSCGGDCLHTGMCCYDVSRYNTKPNRGRELNNELYQIGNILSPMAPMRKRRVPYYVTEWIRTFAGTYWFFTEFTNRLDWSLNHTKIIKLILQHTGRLSSQTVSCGWRLVGINNSSLLAIAICTKLPPACDFCRIISNRFDHLRSSLATDSRSRVGVASGSTLGDCRRADKNRKSYCKLKGRLLARDIATSRLHTRRLYCGDLSPQICGDIWRRDHPPHTTGDLLLTFAATEEDGDENTIWTRDCCRSERSEVLSIPWLLWYCISTSILVINIFSFQI